VTARPVRLALATPFAALLLVLARGARAHGSSVHPIEDQPTTFPPEAPPEGPRTASRHDWSGFTVGTHVAYGVVRSQSALASPRATTQTSGTPLGGMQLGYAHAITSSWLFGLEADVSFPYFASDGVVSSASMPYGSITEKLDFASTLRARLAYATQRWRIYGTGGLAWSQARFIETRASDGFVDTGLALRAGWSWGLGAELVLARGWSVRLEYLFDDLGPTGQRVASGADAQSLATDVQSLRLGLDWQLGSLAELASRGDAKDDWNVHGQLTTIGQGYFRFRSPYQGANSLSGTGQTASTTSATAFVGLRLWRGAELYVDPEIDQGFGLSDTLGVAAFPNGEAQKASYPVPRFNLDRVFIRQTIGLGGERSSAPDGPNQLDDVQDVSRVTLTVGKLSVGDAFDFNSYASDPRTQFLNWNIYGGGSFDWTMDKPGFTWGALAELHQRRWAARVGYYLVPTVSNANSFDTDIPLHGQYTAEIELRGRPFLLPGALRVFGWLSRANMGSYDAALGMSTTTPGYPDLTRTREVRTNYGVVVNVEQAVVGSLGVFSRASWSPGLVEVIGWTDCDESVSFGAVEDGAPWKRPGDTAGVAGVVEGLSPEARAYFATGGLGILIGDGRLRYQPEQVLEAYYALRVLPWITLTADYQLVANPGYNADRGPVSIFGGRLHVEL